MGALCLAVVLVGWSLVSPRLRGGWQVASQAGVGVLLVLMTRAPLGLRPSQLWNGLRWGSAAAVATATGIAAAAPVGPVREAMSARALPDSVAGWLLLRIPLGTVWAEEAAFRAALAAAGTGAFGTAGGRLLQAAAFGLSHIADARAAGRPPVPTVLATAVGGWLFGWLADRSDSLAAPMMAHLAVNEAGAIAALTLQRRLPRGGFCRVSDPTPAQAGVLDSHAGAARFAYNTMLAAVKANLDLRKAERSYGIADDQLTPVVSWSFQDLRNRWSQIKHRVAVGSDGLRWWQLNSKEAYANAVANLAEALSNWDDSRTGERKGQKMGFPRFKPKGRAAKNFMFTTETIRVESSRHHVLAGGGHDPHS